MVSLGEETLNRAIGERTSEDRKRRVGTVGAELEERHSRPL